MEGDDKLNNDFWDNYPQKNDNGSNGGNFFVNPVSPHNDENKENKEEEPEDIPTEIVGHSRKEKVLSVLIIFVCFVALGAGFYFMNSSINLPIKYVANIAKSGNSADQNDALQQELSRVLELKNKDTDEDTLSDYDELNVYKTSPYLTDSDGDEIDDKKEIEQKTDPNCPANQVCTAVSSGSDSGSGSSIDGNSVLTQSAISQQITSGNADVATVREFLAKGGYSQELLDTTSDEDLMAMYRQTISGGDLTAANGDSAGGSTQVQPSQGVDLSGLNISSVEDLKKLTGAEIRALLLKQGAPADQLAQVDDEQLKTMFLSKLETEISNQQNKQ